MYHLRQICYFLASDQSATLSRDFVASQMGQTLDNCELVSVCIVCIGLFALGRGLHAGRSGEKCLVCQPFSLVCTWTMYVLHVNFEITEKWQSYEITGE